MDTKRCVVCNEELNENRKPFTYLSGYIICLGCYNRHHNYELVPIDRVKIPTVRLHSKFTEDEFNDFIKSIDKDGVCYPVQVYKDDKNNYWLADGEHRLEQAKQRGYQVIHAMIKKGDERDAIISSVKLNLNRGSVNHGDLVELIVYLKDNMNLSFNEICREIGMKSRGYANELYQIGKYRDDLLKKLKDDVLKIHDAVEMLRSKCSTVEHLTKDQETDHTITISEPITEQGLKDEDLTSSLKEAIEKGKRFSPELLAKEVKQEGLGDEDLEGKKPQLMVCDFCGDILPRKAVAWIKVHADEYDKVLKRMRGVSDKSD